MTERRGPVWRGALLFALTFALFTSFAPASRAKISFQNDRPEVVMEATRYDFGDVFAGEELERNFPVRNAGTKPLELAQKSTVSTTQPEGRTVAEAVWNPKSNTLVRRVSEMRPAPS